MSAVEAISRPPLDERLKQNADGILEQIARDYAVSTFEVVRSLPTENRTIASGDKLEAVLGELTQWGEMLFIVHTADIVLECAGSIPPGNLGRGYLDLHGDSPIGGHIKADNCAHIAFVNRPFMGRPSRSLQFFNHQGEAMFKVFVAATRNATCFPTKSSALMNSRAGWLLFRLEIYDRREKAA